MDMSQKQLKLNLDAVRGFSMSPVLVSNDLKVTNPCGGLSLYSLKEMWRGSLTALLQVDRGCRPTAISYNFVSTVSFIWGGAHTVASSHYCYLTNGFTEDWDKFRYPYYHPFKNETLK